ncbi:MAG: flagellar basal body rod protein FlgB [Psychromonas sp.]|nr:flagellar basal body rod protein FlgB [Psychromonas sp.]
MAINFEKAFGIHQHTIGVRARRTEMLSSNIVNSDTPGYKAKDIDFKLALNNAMSPESKHVFLNMTDSRHKFAQGQSSSDGSVLFRASKQNDVGDGNSVDSEVERSLFMRNNLEYQASLNFLNSKITSLRSAIKG